MSDESDTRRQYGVVEDRTATGLGHCLLWTGPTRQHAEGIAAAQRESTGCPVAVKVRWVTTTEWEDAVDESRTTSRTTGWREAERWRTW